MLDELRGSVRTCDGEDCERELPADPTVIFTSDAGQRHAYECTCGAVTITVVRPETGRRRS